MTAVELRDHCLSLPASSYDFPFDAEPVSVTLKCNPILARDLREAYEAVAPGYHMNKEHWNTIQTGSDLPEEKLRWLVEHSYQLVAAGLPRSKRPAGGNTSAVKASNGSPNPSHS